MTGDGELTFESEDAYSGVIRMNAEGMSMIVNIAGTKIGTCENPE